MACATPMRTLRPAPALILLTVTVLFAGCLGSPELRGIAVQLADVKATPAPDGSAELELSIRYLNENLVGIAVSETEHRVWINGVDLGRIRSDDPVGLPQLGNATMPVRVTVDPGVVAQLRAFQAAGPANYRLETTLMIEAAADELKSRATGTGTVDLSDLGL